MVARVSSLFPTAQPVLVINDRAFYTHRESTGGIEMLGEEELTQYLTCEVELLFTGPTAAVNKKWAADAFRALADRVESGEFQHGNHELTDRVGKTIGSIYVDYSDDGDI